MTREPPVMDSGRARIDETPEYLDSFSVPVVTGAGAPIHRTCTQLVKLAQRLGVMVETEFNGVTIFAKPGDDPTKIAERWNKELANK